MRRLSHDQWDAEFTRLYTTSHDFLFSLARGMPGDFGVTVVTTLVCLFSSHTRLRVHWAPGIPCALDFFRADASCTPRAHHAARMRSCGLQIRRRHCEERSDEAIQTRHSGAMR